MFGHPERTTKTNLGLQQLYRAIQNGDVKECCRLIDNEGVEIDQASETTPFTPLMRACRFQQTEIFELLLEKGADVNYVVQTRRIQWTALHLVAAQSRIEEAKLLLARGADIESRDEAGRTPLFLCNAPALAELLLENGADLEAQDVTGRTAVSFLCTPRRKANILPVLIRYGADVTKIDDLRHCCNLLKPMVPVKAHNLLYTQEIIHGKTFPVPSMDGVATVSRKFIFWPFARKRANKGAFVAACRQTATCCDYVGSEQREEEDKDYCFLLAGFHSLPTELAFYVLEFKLPPQLLFLLPPVAVHRAISIGSMIGSM